MRNGNYCKFYITTVKNLVRALDSFGLSWRFTIYIVLKKRTLSKQQFQFFSYNFSYYQNKIELLKRAAFINVVITNINLPSAAQQFSFAWLFLSFGITMLKGYISIYSHSMVAGGLPEMS